jgi:hypothetical protein
VVDLNCSIAIATAALALSPTAPAYASNEAAEQMSAEPLRLASRPTTPRTSGTGSVPRLALSPEEAATSIGVSRDFFDEHVVPELRIVRRGRRKLVPVRELERWLEREAARALL